MVSDLPFPQREPEPEPTDQPHAAAPTVYVYEEPSWEYHILVCDLSTETLPGAEVLNDLGSKGWELVSVVQIAQRIHFFFKRSRR